MTETSAATPAGATYEIRPLTPETWPAFDDLVIRHNGIFGGCYCIAFHPDGPERGQGREANRALKCSYVEQGKAHAALVFDGDEAVAWAEYGTPEELPGIHHRKQYDAEKEADPDYRITCVFVDRRSFLYNGTRRLYERLGFTYVRPKGLKNCVMSIEVAAKT
jgi:hypothetical protein